MICMDYINTGITNSPYTDPVLIFEREMDSLTNKLTSMYNEYRIKTAPYFLESEMIGIMTESDKKKIENENKNFFGKVGKLVQSMAKKIADLIDKLIGKIKDLTFSLKNNEKKLDRLIKEHPEIAEEKIKKLAEEGGLNFSDFRSFGDMDKAFVNLYKAAKDSKVDPESFKGKCQAFANKINTDKSKLQTAAKVITVSAGAALAVSQCRKMFHDANKAAKDAKETAKKEEVEIYRELRRMSKQNEITLDKMGKMQLLLNIFRLKNGKKAQIIGENVSIANRFMNVLTKSLDSVFDSKVSKSILGDVNDNYKKNVIYNIEKNERKEKEYETRRKNNGRR